MVSLAFKMMAFCIMLNLAVWGITLIGNGGGESTGSWSTGGMQYNTQQTNGFTDGLQNELASPPVEGSDSFGEKILDFFSIGLYSKVKDFLLTTVFSFTNFLLQANIINNIIRNMLNGLISVIYAAAMFELFTGKTIWGG